NIHTSLKPTLFPYTTLFRSFSYNFFHRSEQNVASKVEIVSTNLLEANPISNGFSGNDFIDERSNYNQYYVFNAFAEYTWDQFEKDRKSTRLNSSHVKISYAV